MNFPRTERGLHDFAAAREMLDEKQPRETLSSTAIEHMGVAATTIRTNWRERRTAVVATGAVATLGLIGLGLALFKKTDPVH